jgi:hypothetical protein
MQAGAVLWGALPASALAGAQGRLQAVERGGEGEQSEEVRSVVVSNGLQGMHTANNVNCNLRISISKCLRGASEALIIDATPHEPYKLHGLPPSLADSILIVNVPCPLS